MAGLTRDAHVVRDWHLPADWAAQEDLAVFGAAGPPLFQDDSGTLAAPGGPVTVAVHTEELHGSQASGTKVPGTRSAGHQMSVDRTVRRPPTLLVERRALNVDGAYARDVLARARPGTAGVDARPTRRVVRSRYGPVTLLLSRPWGARTGPDVRVVAVIVPDGAKDAVVLTFTWDDEGGMASLEALVMRTVQQLELVIEEEDAAPSGAAQVTESVAEHGAAFPPSEWVGTWNRGKPGTVAAWLTALVRRLFGTARFGRPSFVVWILLAVMIAAVWALAGTVAGQVVLGVVLVATWVLPLLLTWRSWTLLHGLVTDPRDYTATPQANARTSVWLYVATAAVLGVILFASVRSGNHLRNEGTLVLWVLAHVLLVLLEHARAHARRFRARLAAS
ncbi:hypothetical protein GCM10023169_38750 [Georgenia halophila]|uniref:Uncharacterized protein n=1 Tax=Georgenia halophila TaxID=620889 RepID=A0ABP8LNH4_9MICO